MATLYRMIAETDYSNGGIDWPEGMSANWPKGQERILPGNVWERVMRDGAGKFSVTFYHEPEPEPTLPDKPAPPPVEQVVTEEPAAAVEGAAPNKRAAALAKARAAKAAKKAAEKAADKD